MRRSNQAVAIALSALMIAGTGASANVVFAEELTPEAVETEVAESTEVITSEDVIIPGVGKTYQINAATDDGNTSFTYSSQNTAVATVSNKGLITGVKKGTTKITVSAGGASTVINVMVGYPDSTIVDFIDENKTQTTINSKVTWANGADLIADIEALGAQTSLGLTDKSFTFTSNDGKEYTAVYASNKVTVTNKDGVDVTENVKTSADYEINGVTIKLPTGDNAGTYVDLLVDATKYFDKEFESEITIGDKTFKNVTVEGSTFIKGEFGGQEYKFFNKDGELRVVGDVTADENFQKLISKDEADLEFVATYDLTFNANGGSVSEVGRTLEKGNKYGTLPTPARSGYTFVGWFTAANGGSQVSANTTISSDTTIYAQWKINYTQTEAFVARTYQYALGREPEAAGLKDWNTKLVKKERSGAQLVQGIVFSQEYLNKKTSDSDYVNMLYKVFMDRNADKGGYDYWMGLLKDGVSREYVLRGFAESQEFANLCKKYNIERGYVTVSQPRDMNAGVTGFCSRLYTQALGRQYEVDGLNYWCNMINTKQRTPEEAAEGFINSQEFMNKKLSNEEYVKVLYRTFMGREADASGYSYWVAKLNAGESRINVLHGFSRSQEFHNIMSSYGL